MKNVPEFKDEFSDALTEYNIFDSYSFYVISNILERIIIQFLRMHNKKNIGKNTIEERAINLAQYIIDSKDTVRGTAKKFRNKQKYGTHRSNIPER